MFSRYRCAVGSHPGKEKLASLYWAWFRADGVRVAQKQRRCPDHAKERLQVILQHAGDDSGDLSLCPGCGGDSASDLDPVFLTLYMPRQEQRTFELGTCSACAAEIRISALEGAEPLKDRQSTNGAALDTAKTAWDWMLNG